MASTGKVGTGAKPALSLGAAAVAIALGYFLTRRISAPTQQLLASWTGPLWLTLRIAVISVCIAGVLGIAAGYGLAKGRFPGRDLLEAIGSVPIILPPTVLGYYLLTGLNPSTRLGRFVTWILGGSPIFNIRGCIIAATITAFPFCMRSARSAIAGVDGHFE